MILANAGFQAQSGYTTPSLVEHIEGHSKTEPRKEAHVMSNDNIKESWTNPNTGEKFIHREKADGTRDLLYGPKDTDGQRNHGHAVFDQSGNVVFNRNPRGE